ncbi:hypothetical protein E4T56_gene11669 [Termitomyces sp. T112]|nr:hypothetical protein E4T56_gene11669 [Termitomyces sp. T112]
MQADVMPEYFAEATGQARGPPTLEWCQAVAPCASCTQWDEQCEFEEPMPGVWQDILGQGALHPPRWSISSAGVHLQWAGEDAWGPLAGVGAGGHADGASAGGTLVEGNGRPWSMVEGGSGCGGAAPGASQSPGDGSSTAGGESGGKDSGVLEVLGLGGVLSMEVLEFVGGSIKVFSGLPCVVLRSIALPVDQVLGSSTDQAGVKDLVNLVAVLVLNLDGGWLAGALAREGVEFIGFDGGPPGLKVALIKPNQGAGRPVGGGVMLGIGMFGVGLIGGVDLVLEKLVKGLEVLGNFMGGVGGDVLQGQGESGVVAFVGVEGGDSGGRVGCVVVGEFGGDTAPASGSLVLFVHQSPGDRQWRVGDNVVWESVLGEYVFEKQFGKLQSVVSGVAGDEEGLLGEAANDDEDHVKTFGIGEFNDMIHQ